MLIEELFRKGIMVMGPSKDNPARAVGVFNLNKVSKFPALRLAEMQKMKWLAGEWTSENKVPATRKNPAYTDIGAATLRFCEKDAWICMVGADGRERPFITFDPFSRQWMFGLAEGAYGILRSPGWKGRCMIFTGHMTMIGVDCEIRQTWTKKSDHEYGYVNEERLRNGKWSYVD